jgi:hypothetical protein
MYMRPRWRNRTVQQRRFRPGLGGCLLWILVLVAILIVLSLLFGGFQKGTKAGLGPAPAHVTGLGVPGLSLLS